MTALLNLVRMAVSGTPGVGTITLGAAIGGFLSMSQAGAIDGGYYKYAIESTLVGAVFTVREVGIGQWSSGGGTLARVIVRNSTNNNALVSVASDAQVIITELAEGDQLPNWMMAY